MNFASVFGYLAFFAVGAVLLWDGIRNAMAAKRISGEQTRRLNDLRRSRDNPSYRPHFFELLTGDELIGLVQGAKPLPEYLGDAAIVDLSSIQARAIVGVARRAAQTLTYWSTGLVLIGGVGIGAYLIDGLQLPGSGAGHANQQLETPEYWALVFFAAISASGVLLGHFSERKKEGAHTLLMWAAHLKNAEREAPPSQDEAEKTSSVWQRLAGKLSRPSR